MGSRACVLAPIWALVFLREAIASGAEPPRVLAGLGPGPYFVGQGFELRVSGVASGPRPRIEPPKLATALVWAAGTEFHPVSATGIGTITSDQYRFVTRFRVVARRSGTLEIPSIKVPLREGAGRTQPIKVAIQPVPAEGRPAEFLGGVGTFAIGAEAVPEAVRVGQSLEFRIKVTGPAAWGMTDRPELARYRRPELGLRVEQKPDVFNEEPPARTFVYRLRPTRAGNMVLPPVAVAAFDPAVSRYITRVTAGVPIRVVAVPAFDPATISDGVSPADSTGAAGVAWAVACVSAALLLGAYALLAFVRRRARQSGRHGLAVASRFATRFARANSPGSSPYGDVAHRISEALVRYLQLGMGRPPAPSRRRRRVRASRS